MSDRPEHLRRLGQFTIDRSMLEDHYREVEEIMKHIVVIRCENMWSSDQFEYIGISEWFDIIPQGMMAPEYEFLFDIQYSGTGKSYIKSIKIKRFGEDTLRDTGYKVTA